MIIARHNCDSVENIEKCEKGQHRKYTCTQDICVCLFMAAVLFIFVRCIHCVVSRSTKSNVHQSKKKHYMRCYARLVPKIEVL